MSRVRTHRPRQIAKALALSLCVVLLGSCSSSDVNLCAAPPSWIASNTNAVLAPLLSASISHSRASALRSGDNRIPPEMRRQLAPFFDAETLDQVRWTMSSRRVSLDTFVSAMFPRYRAMTFDDLVVFQTPADAGNISLWAHELVHVEQFRKMGTVRRFSRAYLAHWPEMENTAVDRTNHILDALNTRLRQRPVARIAAC